MEELAEVVAINDVEIALASQIKSTCSSCSQVDSCANGQVAKAIPSKKLSLTLPYPSSLSENINKNSVINVGDCVILSLPEVDVLKSAWQVYLLPIIGLFSLSGLGQFLLKQQILTHELQALLMGVLGGYIGYKIAQYKQKSPSNVAKLQPTISRILAKPIELKTLESSKPS